MCCKGKKVFKSGIIFLFFIFQYWGLMALDPNQSIDQYVMEEWKTTEGLPCNRIYSIAQTPDGYLWFATFEGLVRFDGVKFSTIRYGPKTNHEGRKKKTRLLDILYVDKKGNLWIGGIGHLTKYQYKTGQFTTFTRNNGLTGHRIYTINEDTKGNLWLGFMGCDMERFVDGEFTWFKISDNREYQWVTSILENRKGNLLVGTYKDKVFKFQDGNFIRYEIEGLESNVQKLYEDPEGILWISTNNGLYRVIDNKVTDVYTTRDGLSNNDILELLKDSDGNLWLGTLNGLTRMKKDTSGKVVFETILENHTVARLFEDREKNLWISTDEEGIKRLKNAKFVNFAGAKKHKKEVIYSLFEDRRGDIWLGAHSGKLFRYRNGGCIESLEMPTIPGSCICSMVEDHNGNLWVGTNENGVFKKKGETNTFINFTKKEGLAHNYVITITIDSKNNIWIGTFDGVSRCKNGNFTSVKNRDGLLGKNVYCIYEDKNHHIWIATAKGINVIKKGELTTGNNMGEYLKDIPVTSIYGENSPGYRMKKEQQQVLWIGTYGAGLKRFKNGEFISYTASDGMTSDYIFQVLEDDRENLWLVSDKGILRISKNELDSFAHHRIDKINCTCFGITDGLKSLSFHNQFSGNSILKNRNGEIWFVNKKGITTVNPGKIEINNFPPPVIIEDVAFNDQVDIFFKQDKVIKCTKKVVFHFTAPTFLSPQKIKFKYKLEGRDRGWTHVPPGEKRTASYKSLCPGTYTFKVTACNSDGIWNTIGDSMRFTIKPSFSQTTFFKILAVFFTFITLGTVFFIYKRRFVAKNDRAKYNNSSLNPLYVEECLKRLTYLMEVEKVYRDETISLQSLSEKLSISPHHLSRILNENVNKNFSAFVNTYRIEEVKKRLNDPGHSKQKILAIAVEVGFNTKVAFNSAFKKYTGMTPSQYRRKLKKHK